MTPSPRCRRRWSRRVAAGLAALVAAGAGLLLVSAGPAGAHALVETSDPADGARLDAAPEQVSITFNEDVRASLGAVRVVDGDAERVDTGAVEVDGQTITIGLEPDLPDGTYTVAFRVISADSHPVRGGLVFTVGDPPEGATALELDEVLGGGDRGYEVAGAALRAVAYVAVLLAAGGAAFLLVVHDGGPGRPRLALAVQVAAVVGAAAVLLGLPVQAALATGLGLDAITEPGVLGDVLADGVGPSIVTVLAGLVAASVAVVLEPGRVARTVALAGAVAAAGGFALAGHTRESDPGWLVAPADAVHAVAAAAWFGGLVLLAATLKRRLGDGDAAGGARVIDRFSGVATVAIAALVVAGLVVSWAEVRSLSALDTTYGLVLLAKLAVAAVVGAVALWNHYRLLPRVQAAEGAEDGPASVGLVRRAVRTEAIGLVVVLAVTAVLVNVTPARTAEGIGQVFSETKPIGDYEVNLVVDPARTGENEYHLYFYDETGAPLTEDPFESVTLRLDPPGDELGAIEREPSVAGPGHWSMVGDELAIAGQWDVEVEAREGEFGLITADFDVRVGG